MFVVVQLKIPTYRDVTKRQYVSNPDVSEYNYPLTQLYIREEWDLHL